MLVEQQIRGLDVAMDDAALVRELQSPRGVHDAIDGEVHRERAALFEQLRQIFPVNAGERIKEFCC